MIKRIVSLLIAAGLMVVSLGGCSNNSSSTEQSKVTSSSIEYENKLFDTSYVHKININISDDDLDDLYKNPLDKTKYQVDVTIDDNECKNVSFATKGNTSLTEIANNSDTDRYSFKINFGKYVDGQNYYGLDKLSLNNIMADSTYMKDYLSYKIMREMGVSSSLASYVELSINGEKKGLYLAVEDVSDSFIDRNYGSDSDGDLYKPETSMLANMNKGNGGPDNKGFAPNNMTDEEKEKMKDKMNKDGDGQNTPPGDPSGDNNGGPMTPPDGADGADGQMPPDGADNNVPPNAEGGNDADSQGGKGNLGDKGFGSSSKGAALLYTDDNADSYSDIFDNAETDVTDEDKKRLIASIKELNENNGDLSNCLNVDEVIKYFACHNFVDNYDSYTGNMLHNYFLYEEDGKISVLPWDYNLAFGSFGGFGGDGKSSDSNDSATKMVNYPIDSPLSGATEDQRPLWKAIIQNDEYKKLYHKYFDELISKYFESGNFN